LGTAYTIWTGIGAIGTVVLGIALFGEPATAARLTCISLILVGIVGLKLSTSTGPKAKLAPSPPPTSTTN
jgi:quaternary ammonium compound-resistance protein SugE